MSTLLRLKICLHGWMGCPKLNVISVATDQCVHQHCESDLCLDVNFWFILAVENCPYV